MSDLEKRVLKICRYTVSRNEILLRMGGDICRSTLDGILTKFVLMNKLNYSVLGYKVPRKSWSYKYTIQQVRGFYTIKTLEDRFHFKHNLNGSERYFMFKDLVRGEAMLEDDYIHGETRYRNLLKAHVVHECLNIIRDELNGEN